MVTPKSAILIGFSGPIPIFGNIHIRLTHGVLLTGLYLPYLPWLLIISFNQALFPGFPFTEFCLGRRRANFQRPNRQLVTYGALAGNRLPETNISLPWKWMVGRRSFPSGTAYVQGRYVGFRECSSFLNLGCFEAVSEGHKILILKSAAMPGEGKWKTKQLGSDSR